MPKFGAPGEQIAYEVTGAGPPLLLVHGFTASRASFHSNIEPLSRDFTLVVAELLGHGRSDAPEDPAPYAPEPAVQRLRGLVESLGYRRVLLCGHSLGGALALRLAIDLPRMLSGLVIINSNSAFGPPGWKEGARAGMKDLAERIRRDGTAALHNSWLYPAQGKRLPPDARNALRDDFDRLTPHAIANTGEALVCEVNVAERLHELTVPTLVVFGDRDTGVGKSLPGFLDRLPEGIASLVTLEGAGHAANLERPREFEAAIREFAAETSLP